MATIIFYDTGGTITSVSEPALSFNQGAGFNAFNEVVVTSGGTEQTILTQIVSDDETLRVDGFAVWGDVDASYTLYVDDGINPEFAVGGCRTTTAKITEEVIYGNKAISIPGPVTVRMKAAHYAPASHMLRANLFGSINTNAS